MASENRLWGAPRIHGELLKLGVIVSERTVSRYLPDRLATPSQTWRTFLANHLGNLAYSQWACVNLAYAQRTSLGWRVAQNQLHRRTRTRFSCGKDPPKSGGGQTVLAA